jgi:outer membrane protein OmpA-like peptidoglycan-associated protein
MLRHLITISLLILGAFIPYGFAQGTPIPTEPASREMPNERDRPSMWEVGIKPYYAWVSGDVEAKFGYGGGLHLRKSLDHIFSLRFDALYAQSSGDNEKDFGTGDGNRRFESDWYSGTVLGVVTLNNFNFRGDVRSLNVNAMAGAGANFFSSEFQCNINTDAFGCSPRNLPFREGRNGRVDRAFQTHFSMGAGLAFRLSERLNIGVEYLAHLPVGNRADRLDGYPASVFGDVQHVAGLSLNINIGNASRRTEPRYWTNAFTPVKQDIAALNQRVDAATTDSDGDGIVDSVDQEPDTPTGVPVDTRGRTLDSDRDGVPDYRDEEPFFPPRAGESVNAEGVVIDRIDAPLTQPEIQEMIDTSIARAMAQGSSVTNNASTRVNTNSGAIYLPMISFPINQATVSYNDYGVLASIARLLTANPDVRLIVRGYTDRTGNAENNRRLSYRRAANVIDHLITNHELARDRFVLQYRGEDEAIVPLDRSRVNRRVEFLRAGADAVEDDAPE